MRRRLVAAVALICFSGCATGWFTGCSWTATIARTDGLDNEAQIDHSDADALYLRDRRDRLHRVERNSVKGIDHPGNVEIVVGVLLMAFTALIVHDYRDEGKSTAPVVLIWGAPAGALILSGLARYIPSVRAAHAFESADDRPRPREKLRPDAPAPPPPPAPPQRPQQDDEQPEVIPDAT